jgi:chromosome partitioning protein
MRIVVLASRKGGSGKTTLAGHLAVQAEMSGAGPVALIDSDPQGSLADWWNLRAAETPHFVQAGCRRPSNACAPSAWRSWSSTPRRR